MDNVVIAATWIYIYIENVFSCIHGKYHSTLHYTQSGQTSLTRNAHKVWGISRNSNVMAPNENIINQLKNIYLFSFW